VGELTDKGISGAKDKRPQLDAMMRLVHRGGRDIGAVWKFDRFARSTRFTLSLLGATNVCWGD
jgi:DNA invertase Pin-like site-specific DNA recombinase